MKPAQVLLAAIAAATFAAAAHAEPDRLGLTLGPQMVVEEVTGPAASAGIQPGDKLLAVDGTPVQGVETLRPFENVTGSVALLVQRDPLLRSEYSWTLASSDRSEDGPPHTSASPRGGDWARWTAVGRSGKRLFQIEPFGFPRPPHVRGG